MIIYIVWIQDIGKCLVSKKKRRFKANGYNLDLSYFMTRSSRWAFRQRVSSPTCWKRFWRSLRTSRRITTRFTELWIKDNGESLIPRKQEEEEEQGGRVQYASHRRALSPTGWTRSIGTGLTQLTLLYQGWPIKGQHFAINNASFWLAIWDKYWLLIGQHGL